MPIAPLLDQDTTIALVDNAVGEICEFTTFFNKNDNGFTLDLRRSAARSEVTHKSRGQWTVG